MTTIKHAPHTQATFEERMNHIIHFGGESYFTDQEAEVAISILEKQFRHITAVHRCPSTGFTRLSGDNVNWSIPMPKVSHVNQ